MLTRRNEKLPALYPRKPSTRYAVCRHDNDLTRRVHEHREGLADGFTKEHAVKMLMYFEQHATAIAATQREKNIKRWPRKWKVDPICSMNPDWRDLWEDIVR